MAPVVRSRSLHTHKARCSRMHRAVRVFSSWGVQFGGGENEGGYGRKRNGEAASTLVMWPSTFDEVASTAVAALKDGRSVVVNMENLTDKMMQQRAVDFVAGGCHALDGHQEMLGDSVFLFTPPSVTVHVSSSEQQALLSLARMELEESYKLSEELMSQADD